MGTRETWPDQLAELNRLARRGSVVVLPNQEPPSGSREVPAKDGRSQVGNAWTESATSRRAG